MTTPDCPPAPPVAAAGPERVAWLRYVFGPASMPAMCLVQLAVPQIVAACGIAADRLGAIGAAVAVVNLLAGVWVAYAADRRDLRGMIVVCLVLASGSILWLAGSLTAVSYLVTVCLAAAGGTVASGGTYYKLVRGARDGGLAVVRYQLVAAAATTALPLFAGWAMVAGRELAGPARGWRWAVGAVALLQLAWIVQVVRAPREEVAPQHRPGWERYRKLLGRGRAYGLALLAVLHVGADGGAFYWVVLLAKRSFPQVSAGGLGLAVAVINSSYAVGRWLMFMRRGRPMTLGHMAALVPLGAAGMAVMAFRAPSYGAFLLAAWLGWFFLSFNFPILHRCAAEWFPETPAAAMGFVSTVSSFGLMAGQYLVGLVSKRTGDLALGFLVPMGMMVLLSASAGVMFLLTRERRPR